jgi:cell division protease FtsH
MSSSFSMNKRIPKKHWWYLVTGALVLAAAGGVVLSRRSSVPSQPTALGAMLQQVRSEPTSWTAVERDVSVLLQDMHGNNVAGLAVAPGGLFVSTRQGTKYFVSDNAGKLAGLVLASYERMQPAGFPLAVVGEDVHDAGGSHLDLGLLMTIALLSVAGIQVARVYRGNGFNFSQKESVVTFEDVIGAGEAKSALMDIKSYLKDPKGFVALGARPPKGVLLSGPPGTGKTRLAKALAGECGVHFIPATGSDFTAMFVGMGAMRVKSLFRKARKNAPCIIFIDEMDGIGRRTNTETGGTSEAEGNRIINQILTELDGFNSSSGVIVIGATNFPDAVDPALVREGRFDRKVQLTLPDVSDREALFRLFAKDVKTGGAPDYFQLARLTTGLTPAAIASVVNQAALLSARHGQQDVPMTNFLEAIEVCRMGEVNGSSSAMTERERERIAVHEAGHAILAQVMNVGRVEKVTILSRGGALGVTLVTQTEDKKLHLKSEIQGRIQMLLAGRAAELITYDDASSGAASDLKEASRLALTMVATLGLSDTGTLFSLEALSALNIRPDPNSAVAEAEAILSTQNERCLTTLRELRGALLDLTAKLVEHETIDGEEVARAISAARSAAKRPSEAACAAA